MFSTSLARVWIVVCVAAVMAAAMGGCTRTDGPATDAVLGYLDGLAPALHADTLSQLAPYATDEEIDRVRLYVAKTLNDGFRMEAVLNDVSVVSAESDGGAATVETREDWTIRYTVASTGLLDRSESYRIKTLYHLVLVDGTWLVSEVEETDRVTR